MQLSEAQQKLLKKYEQELAGLNITPMEALALIGAIQSITEKQLDKIYRLHEKTGHNKNL